MTRGCMMCCRRKELWFEEGRGRTPEVTSWGLRVGTPGTLAWGLRVPFLLGKDVLLGGTSFPAVQSHSQTPRQSAWLCVGWW